jgi:3-oxoacyl-[acyl-carrier-protein] synthase II
MESPREVVITGMGVVSPIGIGIEEFWNSLLQRRSGVRILRRFDGTDAAPAIGSEVANFEPAKYVRPRKALKLMSRDIQLAFTAADMACAQAGLKEGQVDPERFGVEFGADLIAAELEEMVAPYQSCMIDGHFDYSRWGNQGLSNFYPLWMLKYLPNMPACHIGIVRDARGPNNTHTMGEVSALSALIEAVRTIQRGQADAIVAGGIGCRNQPIIWARRKSYELSQRYDDPAAACRPFDADRDGMVFGEGSAAFLLESRQQAAARGAKIYACILGGASSYEPLARGAKPEGLAIRRTIQAAIRDAGLEPADVGHVNADGLSTLHEDRIEARAIRDLLGDVPVTAPKSFFGNLSAGSGAVELAVSLLAFQQGTIPPVLNYCRPDPECPINVIRDQPIPVGKPVALVLSHSRTGHSMGLVVASGQ